MFRKIKNEDGHEDIEVRAKKDKKATRVKISNTKKIFSGRTTLFFVCALFACLLIFVISPLLTGAIGNQVEVVRVTGIVYAGNKVSESQIEVVKISRGSIPNGAVMKKADAIGKYTNAKLVPGDYIMSEKLNDNVYGNENYLVGLDGKKRIISVKIPEFSAGISSKIKAGDIVTIYGSPAEGKKEATEIKELKYVKVVAATLASGADVSKDRENTEMPTTVTMLVNEQQAQLLAGLNQSTSMHFVLVCGDEVDGQIFLDEQDKYFSNGV